MNVKSIKTQISEESQREQRIRNRIKFVTIGIGIVFLIVLGRAVELHCVKDKELGWVASKQYQARVPQSLRRGRILDRASRELAVSLPVPSIYADPRHVNLTDEQKIRLASLLDMNVKDLSAKLKSGKKFVWLKRMVDRNVLEQIKDMSGIYAVEESKRVYPNGELASQLLGAVGMDSQPLAGVELAWNDYLSTSKQEAVYRRDARGKFYFSPVAYQEQSDVDDVYLTIDKQIQFVTENSLKKAVENANAAGGTAIVMDVETGAILAMANMPLFDPNRYSKYEQSSWRNRGITDTVEPGSTFKVLIVASALDAGVITPESVFDCENGAIKVGKAVLHDHDPYGKINVRDIIKVSSNIGALKIARELGKEKLFEYLKKFGIGKKTGIDFPGEVGGIVRPVERWQPVDFATIAFGQGISVTPLQMTAAFASIANGGKLLKPYVIDKVVNNQGITIYKSAPVVKNNAISPQTAQSVIKVMESVVGEGGTGTKAASKEYSFAGKTGTAQKVTEGSGRYAQGKYYASFVGVAPSDKPKVAIFVGLDEPKKGSYYGGAISAPVFKEVAEVTLKYLEVPSAMSKVVYATKGPSQMVTEGVRFQPRLLKTGHSSFMVPDVRGASMREVMNSVGQAEVKIKVDGSGMAVNQQPAPGDVINEGETFFVSFRQPE